MGKENTMLYSFSLFHDIVIQTRESEGVDFFVSSLRALRKAVEFRGLNFFLSAPHEKLIFKTTFYETQKMQMYSSRLSGLSNCLKSKDISKQFKVKEINS